MPDSNEIVRGSLVQIPTWFGSTWGVVTDIPEHAPNTIRVARNMESARGRWILRSQVLDFLTV
jgi:hypothetical protein